MLKSILGLRAGPSKSGVPREFTGEKVRYFLRSEPDSPQAEQVRWHLERVCTYMHDPALRAKYRGLEGYHNRLPSIISMYLRGRSVDDIADYYKPVFTTYGIERALEILSEHIADRLNKDKR